MHVLAVITSVSHASHHPSHLSLPESHSVVSISSLATTHPETMVLRLEADQIGYGMSLQGGFTERGSYPITIASVEDGGPAAK